MGKEQYSVAIDDYQRTAPSPQPGTHARSDHRGQFTFHEADQFSLGVRELSGQRYQVVAPGKCDQCT
ncbi:hypothetical protein [Streptomyces sp. H39-S7]|uniref:hypothetical protein n=1 Tax=Streptomyces sp. H39-S7 TaxID=3004357 RepID=UPI0022B04E3D|nr:hypothetical protein [Streptomyces sp. H39-S7]MCZ4118995.1 hypothetical protein [Streptomyces sp. H39-S7]